MKRVTACVSGKVQKAGYRSRVVQIAKILGLKGIVENLDDGRVKIIVEGDDDKLKWFEEAINIKNTLIQVSGIEKDYSPARGEFNGFGKIVMDGETDSRLDTAAAHLKDLIIAVNNMNENVGGKIDSLGSKIDNLGGKIDNVGGKVGKLGEKMDTLGEKVDCLGNKMDLTAQKQDQMLHRQDELLVEVKDMNRSLNDKMDKVLDNKEDIKVLKGDVAEIKAALRAKGII